MTELSSKILEFNRRLANYDALWSRGSYSKLLTDYSKENYTFIYSFGALFLISKESSDQNFYEET